MSEKGFDCEHNRHRWEHCEPCGEARGFAAGVKAAMEVVSLYDEGGSFRHLMHDLRALSAPREDAHAPPPMCPVCRNGTVIAPWNCVCNGVAPAPVGGSVAPSPKERCAECGGTGEIKRTGWPDERCPCGGRGQR